METTKRAVFGIILVMVLFSISFISAFSVGMPYMEDKKLYLQPGDVRDLEFILQNSGGTENTNARAKVVEGFEVIRLVDEDDIYLVVPGEQTPVNFQVKIPENAQIGESYHVRLDFASEAAAGGFSFGSAIEQNFDVIVGEKPKPVATEQKEVEEEKPLRLWIYVIIALVLIAIIIFYSKKKK